MLEERCGAARGKSRLWWKVPATFLVSFSVGLLGCEKPKPIEPFSRETFFSTGGRRLHFVAAGEGEAVLLLHDAGTWSYSFRETIEALSDRYKVLAADLPGCGLSDKPPADDRVFDMDTLTDNLASFLRSERAGEVVVVGHGWGGNVALALAVRHPRAVRGLVVSGAWALAEEVKPPLLARVSRVALVGDSACAWLPKLLLRRHFGPLFGSGARVMTSEWLEQVSVPAAESGWCNVFRLPSLYAPFEDGLAKALGEIEVRALLLWGEKDELAPISAAKALEQKLANSRLQVFSGAGHMLLEERPVEFNGAVLTFLESLGGGAPKGARRRVKGGPALPKPDLVAEVDRRCPCVGVEEGRGPRARSLYRRCVRDVSSDLRSSGAITGAEQAALIRRSARSTCGRPNFVRCCRRSRCRITTSKRCERMRAKSLGPGSCYPNPCPEAGAD